MAVRWLVPVLIALSLVAPAVAEQPARQLFGAVKTPAEGTAQSIGSYAKGCLAGAVALPIDGPAWQVMRLSRNRNWGDQHLVDYIGWLAGAAHDDGWPGLLIGDMSQPRGGPMSSGHASHQIGLDVDIWLRAMPDSRLTSKERENLSATSVITPGTRTVNPDVWSLAQAKLIYRAAMSSEVARIFVNPGIKQAMCKMKWADRAPLRKLRPWYGHDDHFHVRLNCPAGESTCVAQDPPPPGDGCGDELSYWLSDAPYKPADPAAPPAKPLMLADLPQQCSAVLKR